jgi:single-strand DNA-binding protein
MSLPTISGEFGVVQDPDIRFSDNGSAWIKLRGVAKDRRKNQNGEWEDGDPCYIDIVIGGKAAEHLAESITVGDAIIVTGQLTQREWKNDNGQTQKAYSLRADSVGVSTRFTPAPTPRFKNGMASTPAAREVSEEAPF